MLEATPRVSLVLQPQTNDGDVETVSIEWPCSTVPRVGEHLRYQNFTYIVGEVNWHVVPLLGCPCVFVHCDIPPPEKPWNIPASTTEENAGKPFTRAEVTDLLEEMENDLAEVDLTDDCTHRAITCLLELKRALTTAAALYAVCEGKID